MGEIVVRLHGELAFRRAGERMMRRAGTLSESLHRAQRAMATEIRRFRTIAIRAEAPVKTGALREGITSDITRVGEGLVVTWYSDQDYVGYVLEGTAPHVIYPVNAQALAFMVNGQQIFARSVNHPGTKANPFVERATERTRPLVDAALALAGREILVTFRGL